MDVREKINPGSAPHSSGLRPSSSRTGMDVGRTTWLICLAITALCLSAACAKPPYNELEAAEATIREARSVGAPTYVPEDYRALEAKLESAQAEISNQYKVSEFSRDYSVASRLLVETRAEGDRIIAEALKRSDEAKAAALQESNHAKEAVNGVRELVERAEQANGSALRGDRDELKTEADDLRGTLAEVQTAIEANNHLAAKEKAKAVQEKSRQLQHEVQATGQDK